MELEENTYTKNLIKGLKWLPIHEKAMEIHEEFEKKNENDSFYYMGISDVLYYALCIFQKAINEHDGDVHELIRDIREDFISKQEANLRFMGGFGALESEFEDILEDIRDNKSGQWKRRGF